MKTFFTLVLLSLSTIFVKGQINLTDSLVLLYNFNGNTNDISGLDNDGQNNNMLFTPDQYNNPNNAGQFNGNSAFVRLFNAQTNNSLQIFDGDFAIACWIKNDQTNRQMLFQKGLSGTTSGSNPTFDQLWIRLNDPFQTIRFTTYSESYSNPNESVSFPIGPELNDGNWHYLVAQRKGHVLELSWDGCDNSIQETGNTIINCNNDTTLLIGVQHPNPVGGQGYQFWYSGAVDEFRIYDRSLRCEEIDSLSVFDPTTSIQEQLIVQADEKMLLSPNPANSMIQVHLPKSMLNSKIQFTITTVDGKTIYAQQLFHQTDHHTIKLGHWPSGIYLLSVSNDQKSMVERFVLKND